MAMWFKLKKDTKDLPPLRNIKEEVVSPRKPTQTSEETQPRKMEETYQEPPLFIKLDKYRDLVNSLAQLKALTQMIKNSIAALERLQKTQMETISMIKKTLANAEQKINKINSELVKPPMVPFISTVPELGTEEYQEIESINATVSNLKEQIEQLKQELSNFK